MSLQRPDGMAEAQWKEVEAAILRHSGRLAESESEQERLKQEIKGDPYQGGKYQ